MGWHGTGYICTPMSLSRQMPNRLSHRLRLHMFKLSGHPIKAGSLVLASLLTLFLGSLPLPSPLAEAAGTQALIKSFPSVSQWYNLDCEYAAAAAVTLYWG